MPSYGVVTGQTIPDAVHVLQPQQHLFHHRARQHLVTGTHG